MGLVAWDVEIAGHYGHIRPRAFADRVLLGHRKLRDIPWDIPE
jgi:hypothetical protein